jgi:hypothetical protein
MGTIQRPLPAPASALAWARCASPRPLDFREAARRRLPRFLFDYIDGAAYAERTARRNVEDLAEIALQAAGPRRRLGGRPLDDPVRRPPEPAGDARPGRPQRPLRPPRRGAGGARGRGQRRAGLPLQPVGLWPSGGGGRVDPAGLVPALHHQGPGLHGRAPRRRPRARLRGPHVHRRPADARRPLPRPPFRHVGPPSPLAPFRPGARPPVLGLGRRPPRPSPRPRQFRAGARARRAGSRIMSAGSAAISTRRSPGATSTGSATHWPGKLVIKGILDPGRCQARRRRRGRRHRRLQPRRPPAGRSPLDRPGAPADRRGGRRQNDIAGRRRRPLRPRRAPDARLGRGGRAPRPGLGLRFGRGGRGGGRPAFSTSSKPSSASAWR